MTPLHDALARLGAGRDLTDAETREAVAVIVAGEASEAAVAAFLTALRVKGETSDELAGAVEAVRARALAWEVVERPSLLLDTCGTGGDGAHTVNISTATAIVAAACGVPVVKHGNRAASGNSGSAEVLAELGVAIEAEPAQLDRCLRELGIAFLFAPRFHPALRHAAAVRKQLPFRTLFNLVGPLANPARPSHQLIGVSSESAAALMARALVRLGTTRSAVVHGLDGLDEVSLSAPTRVLWVEQGQVVEDEWRPEDFGLPGVESLEGLKVSGPADSAGRLRALFAGEPGPVRSMVLANAAAALRVAGRTETLRDGVALAAEGVDTGSARRLLEGWVRLSRPDA